MKQSLELVRTAWAMHRHPRASRAELEAFQDAQLRRLLVHAYERVPYYRKLFDRHRLHPRHIRGTADLELIPITTKQDLRGRPQEQVLASGLDPASLLSVRTSGSSGEPFTIRRTWMEDKLQYLLRLRTSRSLGIRRRDRIVTVGLAARPHSGDNKFIGRTLRMLRLDRRRVLDGLQDPETLLRQLGDQRADVLMGLPGMLGRLAGPELANLRRGVRPRLVLVGGEVLTPAMRLRLRDAFEAPVLETYGSHEVPLLAWECRASGDLHVCDDGVIVEVLRDGRPVQPGERGEVVVTNLHAYAMPFIRYRLGDIVTQVDRLSGCGQPFSSIGTIQGRMVDYFPLPNGRMLHPYEIVTRLVWGPADWIRQYQLVQEDRGRIVLRVAARVPPGAERLAEIEHSVRPLLGPDVDFQVHLVDHIPVEKSGKLRPSRSLVQSDYDGMPWGGSTTVTHEGPALDHG